MCIPHQPLLWWKVCAGLQVRKPCVRVLSLKITGSGALFKSQRFLCPGKQIITLHEEKDSVYLCYLLWGISSQHYKGWGFPWSVACNLKSQKNQWWNSVWEKGLRTGGDGDPSPRTREDEMRCLRLRSDAGNEGRSKFFLPSPFALLRLSTEWTMPTQTGECSLLSPLVQT